MRRIDVRGLPNVLKRDREQLARHVQIFTQNPTVPVDPRKLSRYALAAREWFRVKRDEEIELHAGGKLLVPIKR